MPNETRPFLGTTTDRKKAFPDVEEVELEIEQDIFKHHVSKDHMRFSQYTIKTIPRFLTCVNPRCRRGDIDLQLLVSSYSEGQHDLEFCCNGDEGTPKGRRKGNPCDNWVKIKMRIKKK